jgi:hypothetical protein
MNKTYDEVCENCNWQAMNEKQKTLIKQEHED